MAYNPYLLVISKIILDSFLGAIYLSTNNTEMIKEAK